MLRSNLVGEDPAVLWERYVQLAQIEAVFKVMKSELGIRPLYHQLGQRVEAHILVGLSGLLLTDYAEESAASSRSGPHSESCSGKAGHHTDARCVVTYDRWPVVGDAALHSAGGRPGHSAAQAQARVAAATATADQESSSGISSASSLRVVPTFLIGPLKINELGCEPFLIAKDGLELRSIRNPSRPSVQ